MPLLFFFLLLLATSSPVTSQLPMTLQMLPLDHNRGAFCLDGTPPGYLFRAGRGTGVGKWLIWFQGGGWCTSPLSCLDRSNSFLGTSIHIFKTETPHGILSSDPNENPHFYNWNAVRLHSCDGGSFLGNLNKPYIFNGTALYFRGRRIVEAVLDDVTTRFQFLKATDVIVCGASAGGIAAMMYVDRIAAMFSSTNATVKAFPQSGFFMDHNNLLGEPVFATHMRRLVHFMNITPSLPPFCRVSLPPLERWRCILPSHAYPFVDSPLFISNSFYDAFQQDCVYASDFVLQGSTKTLNCSAVPGWTAWFRANIPSHNSLEKIHDLTKYANEMIDNITSSPAWTKRGNGGFLYSCFSHCMEEERKGWMGVTVGGYTVGQAFAKFYFGFPIRLVDCLLSESKDCNPSCPPYFDPPP